MRYEQQVIDTVYYHFIKVVQKKRGGYAKYCPKHSQCSKRKRGNMCNTDTPCIPRLVVSPPTSSVSTGTEKGRVGKLSLKSLRYACNPRFDLFWAIMAANYAVIQRWLLKDNDSDAILSESEDEGSYQNQSVPISSPHKSDTEQKGDENENIEDSSDDDVAFCFGFIPGS
ncbi:hypothetical protein EVAR_11095_1 [Eumeta japonica]|uniref:Uncharacterized protein n=1 Tax=Eumeta variegata TaxID=151549 RepID=A0A4C1U517_EUMVA|nr:hypothetical protein EVAR_11095_1 [Eumeta japonica]